MTNAQTLFDDGKEPDALRTIGEVATAFGIRQHVLRYWEQQFPMLRPLKRSGGRRYYRPEDVALVGTIDRLVNREGYTLKGARQAIDGGAARNDRASASPAAAGMEPAAVNSAPVPEPAKTSASAISANKAGAETRDSADARPASELLPQLRAMRDRLASALGA